VLFTLPRTYKGVIRSQVKLNRVRRLSVVRVWSPYPAVSCHKDCPIFKASETSLACHSIHPDAG